jgi:hypothetical protein
MEIHYAILREHGARAAHEVLEAYSTREIEFSLQDIEAAMKLRYELRNLGLSCADAFGIPNREERGNEIPDGRQSVRKAARCRIRPMTPAAQASLLCGAFGQKY